MRKIKSIMLVALLGASAAVPGFTQALRPWGPSYEYDHGLNPWVVSARRQTGRLSIGLIASNTTMASTRRGLKGN